MEQINFESGDYMNDLEALIHLKTHESFKAKAELDVLIDLIQKTKAECDTIAEKIKTVEHSCCPKDKEEHISLSQAIFDKWSRYKYRSGTANSNTVNSKFHLIRSLDQVFARFLSFHVLHALLIRTRLIQSFTKSKSFTYTLIRSSCNSKV